MFNAIVGFFREIGGAIATAWSEAKTLERINMVFMAVTAVTGVKGFLQARQMMSKGQDIMANKTAAGGKIPVIYGTRRVGAQIVYMDTAQNRSKDLFVVYAISVGECEEILGRTIEIDGNSILDGNIYKGGGYVGSDKISSGNGSLNTASQVGDNQYSQAGTLGTDPTKRYSFVFNLHHGASSQTADPMLRASIPTEWTTNHKLNGICYLACSFDYDKKGMYKGVPQITVQVKGKKVFDPRTSTTAWSSNPALCFLDYIQNDEYGKGLATSQINMTTISAAATKCEVEVDQPYYNDTYQDLTWSGTAGNDFIVINDNDDWWQNKVDEVIDIRDSTSTSIFSNAVTITGSTRYQYYDSVQENRLYIDDVLANSYTNEAGNARAKVKRFHCNGYIDTNKNVMDNAKELLANMRGIFLYIDGKYELQIEDTGTSTFSITDDHIIADAGISVDYGNKDKKANKVVIEFFNANKKYELDTATVLHDASPEYYSDDGEVLEVKAEFPYVTDPYIAYNMGKAILTRSRNQTTMQFLGTPEMYKLNVGDIVSLTYLPLSFNGKVCRVEALELQANGLVSVSLIEYFDVYTWEVPAQEPVEIIAHPPSIGALHPPEASTIVFTDTDASSINRPTLTWTEPTDFPVRQYRVDVVDSSDNNVFSKIVDTPSVDLAFLPKGSNYEASITSFNGVGIESNASTKTFTIADDPVKTTEVEMNGVTMSTVESYGAVTGKTGNYVNFTNKVNFSEIAEFEDGFIVDGGNARFENPATFVDGFTGQGLFNISQGSIQFGSYTPSTTTNNLYNVGGSLYWNGQALGTGTGDITAVVAGSNLNGGGTSGSVTLNLDSTITGNHTFSNNVIIGGDLTVQGTTTTVNTDDLNVKDKNITLNYSTGDSSASANGAGITIQDAVSAGNDATILWNTNFDNFDFSHTIRIPDSQKVEFGADADLQIYHESGNNHSVIKETGTGNLKIQAANIEMQIPNGTQNYLQAINGGAVTLYNNGSPKIATTSSGIDVTGSITTDGLTTSADINFGDDDKALFGASNDLKIYHSANNQSYIHEVGSGDLNILATNLKLQDAGGSTKVLVNSAGIDVTGTVTSDGLTVAGTSYIQSTTQPQLEIAYNSGNITGFYRSGGDFQIKNDNGAGTPETSIVLAEDGAVTLYHDASAKLATTSTGATITGTLDVDVISNASGVVHLNDTLYFQDNSKAVFGDSSDLQIYHDGNNSRVEDTGTGGLRLIGGNFVSLQSTSGENMVVATENGAVTLYHNNSAKLATTSTGIDVTGTVTFDGGTTSANLNFGDGDKAVFGNSSDLQIYHDGSHSYIKDTGTGDLLLSGANIRINNPSTFENHLYAVENGAVTLYYDNAPKLATTSTGIDVTGTTTTDGLTVNSGNTSSNISIRNGSNSSFLNIYSDLNGVAVLDVDASNVGGAPRFQVDVGSVQALRITEGGDISFYDDTGSTQGLFWDASAENLLVGKTSAGATNTAGHELKANGIAVHTTDNTTTMYLNRKISDGSLIEFRKDNTAVGSIGTAGSDIYIAGLDSNHAALRLAASVKAVLPVTHTGALNDNTTNLGQSNARFKDLHLSGTANFGSLSDGTITITGFVDQDNMSSDSPTLLPTQQSVKAYVDANSFTINNNADNRIITGTATAGTLNAETTLTYGTTGADLAITGGSIGGVPPILRLEDVGSSGKLAELNHITGTTTLTSRNATSNGVIKFAGHNGTSETEYGRFDASGNLLVGTTDSSVWNNGAGGNTGTVIESDGTIQLAKSNNITAYFNRLNSDGEILSFRKNGAGVGSIGTLAGDLLVGTGNTGLLFYDADPQIIPRNPVTGANVDATVDLGATGSRFKDLHLSGTANVGTLKVIRTDNTTQYGIFGQDSSGGYLTQHRNNSSLYENFRFLASNTSGTVERARIDASGNLLVGTTSGGNSSAGFRAYAGGNGAFTIAGTTLSLNRLSSNGEILNLQKDTVNVGSIGVGGSNKMTIIGTNANLQLGANNTALLNLDTNKFYPQTDNSVDLGFSSSANRFRDLYLTGTANANALNIKSGSAIHGTITTSNSSLTLNARNTGIMLFQSGGSEKARINASGNLGIGTTSPNTPLDVRRSDASGAVAEFHNNVGYGIDIGTSTADAYISSGYQQNFIFKTNAGSGQTERMRIDSSGRVGIGTNSPSLKLHSKDTGNYQLDLDSGGTRWRMGAGWSGYYQNHFLLADTANGVRMIIDTNGNTKFTGAISAEDNIYLTDAGTTRGRIELNASDRDDLDIVAVSLSSNLKFFTQNTEVGRFDASGRLGIKNSNPTATLTVGTLSSGQTGNVVINNEGGNTATLEVLSRTNRSILKVADNDTTGYISAENGLFSIGRNTGNNSANININSSNNVGIGTNSPSEKLQINDGRLRFWESGQRQYNIGIASGTSKFQIYDATFSYAPFTIDGTGKIGIGTVSPNALADLHVADTTDARIWLDATSGNTLELYAGSGVGLFNRSNNFLNFGTDNVERARITSAGNFGIGTTAPSSQLHLSKAGGTLIKLGTSINTSEIEAREVGGGQSLILSSVNSADHLVIDGAGKVGIGTSSPAESLHTTGNIRFGDSAPAELYTNSSELRLGVDRNNDNGTSNITFYVNNSESARIDASGRLIVGGTSAGQTGATTIYPNGNIASSSITATGDGVFNFNKTETYNPVITANDSQSDTGQVIAVQIGGTTKGNIGISSATGNDMYIASGTTSSAGVGLRFIDYQVTNIQPCRGNGSTLDNVVDLGSVGARFDDIYATNGTIQTSDRNQKQDIQALTEAEQRVATACKGLIRRFRWQDSVAEKDDNSDSDETARYHFGVIAQDLQDAFTAEGLDAGDYGMFISSTWEDDDGVEQTRLGVRYNELLSFIITTI